MGVETRYWLTQGPSSMASEGAAPGGRREFRVKFVNIAHSDLDVSLPASSNIERLITEVCN